METPVGIEVGSGAIDVEWSDGRATHLAASLPRRGCACAGCSSAPSRRRTAPGIESASIIGDHANGITFSPDGHATGGFPYQILRSLGEAA